MKIRDKIFKRKSGKSKGRWIARVEYFDEVSGAWKTMERSRSRKADAGDERDRLIIEIQKSYGQIQTGERMTFSQLVEICKERFFKPAVIVEGRKIEGIKSIRTVQNSLNVLNQFFGKQRIGQITTERLKDYRRWRLKNGSRRPEIVKARTFAPVKLTSINRELAAMRRMMKYAFAQGWITRDIFFQAGVIDMSAERERTRILTAAEEKRLLAACEGERSVTYKRTRFEREESVTASINVDNPQLKAVILLAIDGAMRKGEILKLLWEDLDFAANIIRIVGTNTKTEKERLAPLSERAKTELDRVREFSAAGERPFPFDDFKRSWQSALKIANIEDLHFHDLRRTALTRYQREYGLSLALAGKIAGHTNLQTTMKHYTASDAAIVGNLADTMNAVHAAAHDEPTIGEMLN